MAHSVHWELSEKAGRIQSHPKPNPFPHRFHLSPTDSGAEIWGHSLELNLFFCAMSCSSQSRAQLAAPQTPGKFLGAKLGAGGFAPSHSQGFIVHIHPAPLSSPKALSSLLVLKKAGVAPPCCTTAGLFTTWRGNPMSQPLGAQGIMSGIPLSVTRPASQALSCHLSVHKYILFFCQGKGPRF